jgi:hypothetical protein
MGAFHLDKTMKKGYNDFIIILQKKFEFGPGLFQGFFHGMGSS